MNVEAIKELIQHLPEEEQTELAGWISARDSKAWDDQIERDFSENGAGADLLADVDSQIKTGNLDPFKVTPGQR